MSKTVQITLRFPEEWLPRLDAIAKSMSRPGNDANRTDALRFVIAKGLEPAETELGIAGAKPSKAKR